MEKDHRGLTASERTQVARIGGLTSWGNTTNRTARMETPHSASPADVRWHLKQLGHDPDNPTAAQVAQAESARKLYFAKLAYKSAAARRRRRGGQ